MAQRGSNYAGLIGWSVGRREWLDSPDSKVNRYWRVVEQGSAATKWPWQGQGIAGLWGPNAGPRGGLRESATSAFSGAGNEKLAPYFRRRTDDMLGAARAALWAYMEGGKGRNMERLRVSYVTIYRRQWVHGHDGAKTSRGQATGPVVAQTRAPASAAELARARRALFHWFMTAADDPASIPFVYGTINRPIPAARHYAEAMGSFNLREHQMKALRESLAFALRGVQSGRELQSLRRLQAFDNTSGSARRGRARPERVSIGNYAPHDTAIARMAASVEVQSLFRDDRGRFVNGAWQQSLREANELVAIAFQEAVVAEMRGTRKRPPTDALVRATMDRRNRYPNDRG